MNIRGIYDEYLRNAGGLKYAKICIVERLG